MTTGNLSMLQKQAPCVAGQLLCQRMCTGMVLPLEVTCQPAAGLTLPLHSLICTPCTLLGGACTKQMCNASHLHLSSPGILIWYGSLLCKLFKLDNSTVFLLTCICHAEGEREAGTMGLMKCQTASCVHPASCAACAIGRPSPLVRALMRKSAHGLQHKWLLSWDPCPQTSHRLRMRSLLLHAAA